MQVCRLRPLNVIRIAIEFRVRESEEITTSRQKRSFSLSIYGDGNCLYYLF